MKKINYWIQQLRRKSRPMSKLTDKMDELQQRINVFTIFQLNDVLRDFDEGNISDLFFRDIIVYLNKEKTKCLTVIILDSSGTSIQLIEENKKGELPIFITKNLSYDETVLLVKTILRRYKIKKLQHG